MHHDIFVTGAAGYLGRRLCPALTARGHRVRALARPASAGRVSGIECVLGDALDARTYQDEVAPADTFVHLVGVSKPNPLKKDLFRTVDLASAEAAVSAARHAGVGHFVYVSVAQPAPVMKAYIAVRAECEARIRESGLNATILRPWYVLGPGHRWPLLFRPIYAVTDRIPSTRPASRRLGLVTLEEMISALVYAVEHPAKGIKVVEVDGMKN